MDGGLLRILGDCWGRPRRPSSRMPGDTSVTTSGAEIIDDEDAAAADVAAVAAAASSSSLA